MLPGLTWRAVGLVLLLTHASFILAFDYCQYFLHGVCKNDCDVTSVSLEHRDYLCEGKWHCCVNSSRIMDEESTLSSEHNDVTVSSMAVIPRVLSDHKGIPFDVPCGRGMLNRVKRVVGGTTAASCQLPWMVYISRDPQTEDFCGGALVSERHVITAAHCFDNLNGYDPQVTIAEYNRLETSGMSKHTTSQYKVHRHPSYNRFTYNYDIAVLTLDQPLILEDYDCMVPICLPEANQTFGVDTRCSVAGWGSMSRDSRVVTSPVLVKAKVNIQEDNLCKTFFRFLFQETSQICAGDLVTSADSCQGDSGGPLMCPGGPNDPNTLYLAGVISSGANPCGQKGVPAIYSDVTAVREWIDKIMSLT